MYDKKIVKPDEIFHEGFPQKLIETAFWKGKLPLRPESRTDKSLLRALRALRNAERNPWGLMVFEFQNDFGDQSRLDGINDALAAVLKYSNLVKEGGLVLGLRNGSAFRAGQPVMAIKGPIQELIPPLSIISMVLSHKTVSAVPERSGRVNLSEFQTTLAEIVDVASNSSGGAKTVTFTGARYFHPRMTHLIVRACWEAGVTKTSIDWDVNDERDYCPAIADDILQTICSFYTDAKHAVTDAAGSLSNIVEPGIPVVPSVSFRNREGEDTRVVAERFQDLAGIRVNTAGRVGQLGLRGRDDPRIGEWMLRGKKPFLIPAGEPDSDFWYGAGTSVTLAAGLRYLLDSLGRESAAIYLNGGYSDHRKVKAFSRAEAALDMCLGGDYTVSRVFDFSTWAYLDFRLVAVGHDPTRMQPVYTHGREMPDLSDLEPALGDMKWRA